MHDIMDRVTDISWRTTSGAAIGGFEYEYDAAGRIVSRSHPIGVGDRLASYGMAATAYAAGVYTGVGYDIALGATGGWAAGGTKAAGKEFSHWIPNRVLKRSGSDFWVKKFGRSKFNGNYVTPTRHAQHDPFRHYNSTVKFHALKRQIDRVPRVYYGSLTGCIAGSLSGAGSSEYDKD